MSSRPGVDVPRAQEVEFVRNRVAGLTGTQAAIAANYAVSDAPRRAHLLQKRPRVRRLLTLAYRAWERAFQAEIEQMARQYARRFLGEAEPSGSQERHP